MMLTLPGLNAPPALRPYTPLLAKHAIPTVDAASDNDRPQPPIANDQSLKAASADRRDLQTLARLLDETAACLAEHVGPSAVQNALKATPMVIDPHSSFRQQNHLAAEAPVNLESFIAGKGTYMPTTRADLIDMARALADHTLGHPLGDFGGALSWSAPLDIEQQRAIGRLVNNNTPNLPGFTRLGRSGALDYLLNVQRLTAAELRDPEKALETLLCSPHAQVLGNAIQTQLAGITSDTSVADYVLAAIHIGLVPESIGAPHRNKVAQFDLANASHWGKSPAEIINALSAHLESDARTAEGRGQLAARLLLARTAPHFLVKDIPPQVVYGSQAWANFCIAAATQEADAPGTVRNKTYAQVMSDAASSNASPSEAVVLGALIDWAVCNGHLPKRSDDQYDRASIERARTAFNAQQNAMKTAAAHLGDTLPSRKAMALATLKQQFPGVADELFEQRVLSIKDREFNPGARSMLDIIMEGHTLPQGETWWTAHNGIPLEAFNTFSRSAESSITSEFNSALDSQKQLHQTLVKKLIADLPLADRENLEQGKLEFYKEGTYAIGMGLLDAPALTSRKNRLLIKVERNKQTYLYALDPEKGILSRKLNLRDLDSSRTANTLYRADVFEPKDKSTLARQDPRVNGGTPKSFSSDRTQHIANIYIEALGLEQQARGVTSYDKERAQEEALSGFLLDLVPLRSAIVNFRDGNYGAGTLDLTLDIFGFVTAGLGAGAKAIKAIKNTGSAVSKLLTAGKILGAATLGELNPLSGTGDLLVGAGKLLTDGANATLQGIRRLRGTAGSLDLIEASKHFESAATGTFKVGEHTVEGSAVLKGGHWYAFDAEKMQPYGSPLREFTALNVLMPASPHKHDAVRHDPLSRARRPVRVITRPRVALPLDEYATSKSTNGALIKDHFTPDRIELTREKFSLEMKAFYADMASNGLPRRPVIPDVTGPTAPNQLIAEALKKTDVLVFGENHEDVASLVAMRDAMKTFQAGGVKTIYMEGITLDAYGLVADKKLAQTIKYRTGGSTLYEELKKAAEAFDIEIMPLEHQYLTRHSDNPDHFSGLDTLSKKSPEYQALSKQRLEEMNYYGARQVMKNELGGKSVVWVGRAHMNTSENVPGIAELTGGIGIGVYQKANIGESMARKSTAPKNPAAELSAADETAGDLQLDINV